MTNRGLRILERKRPALLTRSDSRVASIFFWWGVLCILLAMFVPYAMFAEVGIPITAVKLHPSTILAILGGSCALMSGVVPFHTRVHQHPALILFVFGVPVLMAYAVMANGISGSATFPETFWAAGMLAVMLETATPRQKRILGGIVIAICVLNVLIGLGESLVQKEMFPAITDPDVTVAVTADFRAHAFYGHPLTASLVTAMAMFLLYAMRPRMIVGAPIFCIFLIGLLEFGGRTALAVTLAITIAVVLWKLLVGIVRRNLSVEFALSVLAGAIAIPLLVAFVVTQTSIADRIMDTLYFDGSAEARTTQFEVFRHLTMRNWMFGISHDQLDVLKYQIGLGGKYTDIENCWILLFLDLGSIGFVAMLFLLFGFLMHLGRYARDANGWLLVAAALIIDSGANSLGVKCIDLVVEVVLIVAISGYADRARVPSGAIRAPVTLGAGLPRLRHGLGAVASRDRGLRLLGSHRL